MANQNLANHRRWVPLWHFIGMPILTLNVFVQAHRAYRDRTIGACWDFVVALGIVLTVYSLRPMALTVQNRVIRDEMIMRLREVLPGSARDRISELSLSQLIGLRFASSAELPGLVDRCLSGELPNAEAVKKAVVVWVPDELRA